MGVGGRSAVSRKVFRAGHSHRRELRGLFDDALKSGVARALACSGELQFAGIELSAEADRHAEACATVSLDGDRFRRHPGTPRDGAAALRRVLAVVRLHSLLSEFRGGSRTTASTLRRVLAVVRLHSLLSEFRGGSGWTARLL